MASLYSTHYLGDTFFIEYIMVKPNNNTVALVMILQFNMKINLYTTYIVIK